MGWGEGVGKDGEGVDGVRGCRIRLRRGRGGGDEEGEEGGGGGH
jgi:hypothetical protein